MGANSPPMGAGCTRCVTAVTPTRTPTDSEPKADVRTRAATPGAAARAPPRARPAKALDEPERKQHQHAARRGEGRGEGDGLEIASQTASQAHSRSSSLSRQSTPPRRTISAGQPHVVLDSCHDSAPSSTRVPVPPSAISRRERSTSGIQPGKCGNHCSQKEDAPAAVSKGGKLVPLPPMVGAMADRAPETCTTARVGTFGSSMPSALWQRRYGKQDRGAARAPSFLRVPYVDREHCA